MTETLADQRNMPAQRLWSFEEGGVNFAAVAAGPTESVMTGVAPIPPTANTLARVTSSLARAPGDGGNDN